MKVLFIGPHTDLTLVCSVLTITLPGLCANKHITCQVCVPTPPCRSSLQSLVWPPAGRRCPPARPTPTFPPGWRSPPAAAGWVRSLTTDCVPSPSEGASVRTARYWCQQIYLWDTSCARVHSNVPRKISVPTTGFL